MYTINNNNSEYAEFSGTTTAVPTVFVTSPTTPKSVTFESLNQVDPSVSFCERPTIGGRPVIAIHEPDDDDQQGTTCARVPQIRLHSANANEAALWSAQPRSHSVAVSGNGQDLLQAPSISNERRPSALSAQDIDAVLEELTRSNYNLAGLTTSADTSTASTSYDVHAPSAPPKFEIRSCPKAKVSSVCIVPDRTAVTGGLMRKGSEYVPRRRSTEAIEPHRRASDAASRPPLQQQHSSFPHVRSSTKSSSLRRNTSSATSRKSSACVEPLRQIQEEDTTPLERRFVVVGTGLTTKSTLDSRLSEPLPDALLAAHSACDVHAYTAQQSNVDDDDNAVLTTMPPSTEIGEQQTTAGGNNASRSTVRRHSEDNALDVPVTFLLGAESPMVKRNRPNDDELTSAEPVRTRRRYERSDTDDRVQVQDQWRQEREHYFANKITPKRTNSGTLTDTRDDPLGATDRKQLESDNDSESSNEHSGSSSAGSSRSRSSSGDSAQEPILKPHQLLVELQELITLEEYGRYAEWHQTGRWVKYEESLEIGADKFGRPHVSTLSFHSLLELRKLIEMGKIVMGLNVSSYDELIVELLDVLQQNTNEADRLSRSAEIHVQQTLMLKHKHMNDPVGPGALLRQQQCQSLPQMTVSNTSVFTNNSNNATGNQTNLMVPKRNGCTRVSSMRQMHPPSFGNNNNNNNNNNSATANGNATKSLQPDCERTALLFGDQTTTPTSQFLTVDFGAETVVPVQRPRALSARLTSFCRRMSTIAGLSSRRASSPRDSVSSASMRFALKRSATGVARVSTGVLNTKSLRRPGDADLLKRLNSGADLGATKGAAAPLAEPTAPRRGAATCCVL